MDKVIFVTFKDEKQAYQGYQVLNTLHQEGSITMYSEAVLVKDADGKVSVREPENIGPVGTLGGLLAGGLVGMLGGPVGVAIGATAGTAVGASWDSARASIGQEFVEAMRERLTPGMAVLIAEIDETWQIPLDTRMEALGGTVYRRNWTEVQDLLYEKQIEAKQKELANLEAEKVASIKAQEAKKSAETNAKLQAKIDSTKRELQEAEEQTAAHLKQVKEEGEKKVALLQSQMTTANEDAKAELNGRLAEVQKQYQQRTDKLQQSLEKRKAATPQAAQRAKA